jgi:hypothetical protein
MAFAISSKKVHCPNCHYEGRAKVHGAGCGMWLLWLVSLAFGVVFVWLVLPPIICILMFFWLLLKPAKQTCKKCGFLNPIPISQWRKVSKLGK